MPKDSKALGKQPKRISLALQGGGAHGAFTWGVLDRLLEDDRIIIDAVSGTSAGAINAVALAHGFAEGGSQVARIILRRLWEAISAASHWSMLRRSPIDTFLGDWSLDNSPAYAAFDLLQRVASPYDINPFNYNPLRSIIDNVVDFDKVKACDCLKLFISATNVETGRVRVFGNEEINLDVVMASACLPFLFKAVEIDGVPYWDGGYMGNPVLFPFHPADTPDDILIVQINPVIRKGTPKSAREILNRVNEITFNSSLLKELRSIDFVSRLLDEGAIDRERYRKLRIHIIEDHKHLAKMGASSKYNAEIAFLEELHDHGREAASEWLESHYEDIGVQATVDLRAMFQGISASGHHG